MQRQFLQQDHQRILIIERVVKTEQQEVLLAVYL